ncbi:hypothetical protein BGO17_04695 [Candidatus Saccharibacteria bacterium 49-20]|nr:MAG: hypothetical protein BGO17_04695 [Candidatus Saccharibacteria bacterium 49-20]
MASITVTKVAVLSIGKLFGTVNLIIALAVGIIATVAGLVAYFTAGDYGFFEGLLGAIGISLAALLLYPLVMFAFGWLYGVLAAFIFNVVAGVSGGVELTTKTTPAQK